MPLSLSSFYLVFEASSPSEHQHLALGGIPAGLYHCIPWHGKATPPCHVHWHYLEHGLAVDVHEEHPVLYPVLPLLRHHEQAAWQVHCEAMDLSALLQGETHQERGWERMLVDQDQEGRLPRTHLSLGSKGQMLSLSGLDPQYSRMHGGLPKGLVLPFEPHLGQHLLQLPEFAVREGAQ